MPVSRRLGLVLAAVWLLAGVGSAPALARGVVVAKFTDRTGKRLGAKAKQALVEALAARGIELQSLGDYQRAARKRGIPARRHFRPAAVKAVAKALGLDGVVLGSAARVRGRYTLQLRLLGRRGELLWRETYRARRATFDGRRARHAAERILAKLGDGAGRKPEPVEEDGAPVEPAFEPPEVAAAPPLEEAPPASPRPALEPAPAEARPVREERPARREREPEVRAEGAPAGEPRTLPVHDALLAVGPSMHLRSGLRPTHSASLFPGLRVDGQLLLATFFDEGFARGLGVYLGLDLSLGLEYGYRGAAERWPAQQVQGRGGLLYRLDFDVATRPTLLVKLGFGGTACSIDADVEQVVSVRYLAPELGLGAALFLWEPYLRLGFGFAFLVPVIAGDEIGGTGWGWSLDASLDASLWGFLHLGLGYGVAQMRLEEDGMGEVSDTFQGFFLRLGYAFR